MSYEKAEMPMFLNNPKGKPRNRRRKTEMNTLERLVKSSENMNEMQRRIDLVIPMLIGMMKEVGGSPGRSCQGVRIFVGLK